MRYWRLGLALGVIFLVAFLFNSSSFTQIKEGNVPVSKLPQKVRQAVYQKLPGAKIISAYTENEGGEQGYEITAKVGDKLYALEISAQGKVLEFSEERGEIQEKTERGEEQEKEEKEVEGGVLYDFEGDQVGQMPQGWSAAVTGRGPNSQWEIQQMEDAPSPTHVLTQISHPSVSYHFNLAVSDDSHYDDVEISVWLKALTGRIDQGGGLVWRYKDANNYYIARINPLENNFRVYKVVNGRRIQLQSARIPLKAGQWYIMKVENIGQKIECYLDGRRYLEVNESTFKAGRIGLWTKADAVTAFDNLRVKRGEEEEE
ncbi:MAG: hypothetical protein J7L26_04635 [Candidatus Aminicenantes bacterium]|nr:hypothetical protein [Candidatus Aminicenantes bacterium]